MLVPDASRQRWLPALVLPSLAAFMVLALGALGALADRGGAEHGLERTPTAPPPAASLASSRTLPSPASPPAPALSAPLARVDPPIPQAQAQAPEPELRRGFSPVLDRIEPAHRPLGDAVDPNAPASEAPSGREVEVPPSAAP